MNLQRELKSITRVSKCNFGLDQNNFCLGCTDTPMVYEGLTEKIFYLWNYVSVNFTVNLSLGEFHGEGLKVWKNESVGEFHR